MSGFVSVSPRHDEVAREIVDAAIKVHSTLGPGLLESVYERCLQHEIQKRGLTAPRQVALPVHYDGMAIETGFRLDLVVESLVVIELKAVETMVPLYDAQLLTYLKLSDLHLGLLINFNVHRLKNGIKRFVRTPPS